SRLPFRDLKPGSEPGFVLEPTSAKRRARSSLSASATRSVCRSPRSYARYHTDAPSLCGYFRSGDQMRLILENDATDCEIARPRPKLMRVDREATVLEGSRLMRNSGATQLLVVDRINSALSTFGI